MKRNALAAVIVASAALAAVFAPSDVRPQTAPQVRVLGVAVGLAIPPLNVCAGPEPITFPCDPWTHEEVVAFVVSTSETDAELGEHQAPPYRGRVTCAATLTGVCACVNEDTYWAADVNVAAVAYRLGGP